MVGQRQEQPAGKSNNNNNQASSLVTTYHLVDIMRRYYTQTNYAELKRLLYDKTFPITQSFINLALVKEAEQKAKELKAKEPKTQDLQSKERESESQFRDERINSFEDIHKPKEPIQIEQIFAKFKDLKEPQRILIEGRAGIGKTTLCQFIANQWAAEVGRLKSWHGKFKLLIWLPLRELISDATLNFENLDLADIIHRKFLNRHERKAYSVQQIQAELQQLITRKQLLLLLDGYDEIVPSLTSNNEFKEFFEEELLACPNWILTSRPLYAANIKADRRLENIGFASAEIPKYAQQFFKEVEKENQVEPLLKLLESNRNIHGIAHIPINLELICSVWEQEGASHLSNSLNMTGLYDKLVLNLFKRYLHKFHHEAITELTWQDLYNHEKPDCKSLLVFLEQIAWEGMKQPSIVLPASVLNQAANIWLHHVREKASIAVLKNLGILKGLGIERTSILDQEHYFIHLTFQEYFAARYVTNHLNELATQEFISANKFNKRYEIVWWFVAGILGLNSYNEAARSAPKAISSASEKSSASTNAVGLNEVASPAISTANGKEKFKLITYFNLLSDEPHSLLLLHEQILQWRCWDEAGMPDLIQKAQWEKNLLMFTQPQVSIWWGYEVINDLMRFCLHQSSQLLQHYGCQLVQPWLVLLQDKKSHFRIHATEMICVLQVKERWMIERLLALLQDRHGSVRTQAAKVLGAFQVKEQWVIERLWALFQDKHEDVQAKVVKVLGALQVKEQWIIERLWALLQDKEGDVRTKAAEGLGLLQVKERWVIERLLALLQDRYGPVRAKVVKVLGALQVKEQWVIDRLWALLQDKDEYVRSQAAEVVGRLQVKEPKVIQSLLTLLQDKKWQVRVKATEVLELLQVKERWAIERLLVLLRDKEKDVRSQAAEVLGALQVKESEVFKSLLVLLHDKEWEVRAKTANALGVLQMKEPEIIKDLLALLQDEDADVRAQAAKALGALEVKQPEVIKGILSLLQDGEKDVRAQAAKVLRALQVKGQEVIECLLSLLQDEEGDVQAQAVKALGALQVKEQWVIEYLLSLIQYEQRDVRDQAVSVLRLLISEDEFFIYLLEYFKQSYIEFFELSRFSLSLQLRLWLQFPQNNSLLGDIVYKIIHSNTLVYYYDSHLYLEGKLTSLPMPVEQYQILQQAIDAECRQKNIPILDKNLQVQTTESVTSPSTKEPIMADTKEQIQTQNKLLTLNFLRRELFKHPRETQRRVLSILNEQQPATQHIQRIRQLLTKERTIAVELDEYQNTLIHYAAFYGRYDLVLELLKVNRGAPGKKNIFGLQALHIAAFLGHQAIITQLLASYGDAQTIELDIAYDAQEFYTRKAPRQTHIKIHCSTLGLAVLGGQVDVIEILLAKLKPELIDKELIIDGLGNILHLAVLSRNGSVLKTLVHHDAVIARKFLYNQENQYHLTPLSLAATIHNQTAIHILASHRQVKLNYQTNNRKRTVLHAAVKACNLEAIDGVLNLLNEGSLALELLNLKDKSKRHHMEHRTAYDLAVAIVKACEDRKDAQHAKEYRLIAEELDGFDMTSWQQLREKPSVRRPRIRNLVFQGGGPKGIAFIEAIRALGNKLSEGDWSLAAIERVCGSSAGAITAATVALDYDVDATLNKLGSLNLASLLDLDSGKDLTPHIQKIKEATSSNTSSYASILRSAFKDIFNIDASDLLFHSQQLWNNFQQLEGLCAGQVFLNWFNEKIIAYKLKQDGVDKRYPKIDINNFTFGDLRYLIDKGETYKHLHLFAFCIEDELAEVVISSEDSQWDNVRIADGVRACMSIPGIFKPHIINNKKYVDGGLLLNMPIKRFDKVKYLNRYLKGDDNYEVFNEETLGFRMVAAKKSVADIISKVNGSKDLLSALISAFYNAESIIAAAEDKYSYRCVAISDCGVGLLDFDLPETKKLELLAAGSKATAEYFGEYEKIIQERQRVEVDDPVREDSSAASAARPSSSMGFSKGH